MADRREQFEEGVLTAVRPRTQKPAMYKVLLHNDDYTPMEFVVSILERVFHKAREDAVQIMLAVHRSGIGICGIYTYEIAEQKMNTVITISRQHEHPLKCTIEPETSGESE